MHTSLLADWTNDDFGILEKGVLLARHRLVETGLFTDDRLIELFDNHPADCLHINTMGYDTNHFEWREGDRNGVSSEDLLKVLKKGHLWVNIRNLLDHQPEYARVINQMYDELEKHSPNFIAKDRSANLLLSSPTALVHYHVDLPCNMLWHIRGTKRVWVYPHFDERFVSQKVMEMVCAGEFSEDVPYDPSFETYSLAHDLQPGELVTWPQHTPHRVTNLEGLNVSLSTEHKNRRAVRRINVHLANQFLRRKLGFRSLATRVDGPLAHAKETLARAVRMFERLIGKRQHHFTYPISFEVDPSADQGFRLLDIDDQLSVPPHLAHEKDQNQ